MFLRTRGLRILAMAVVGASVWLGAVPGAPLSEASAHTTIEVSLTTLVKTSDVIAVGTPIEAVSVWEEPGDGSRRIVTYHRVRVETGLGGQPGGEVWVRRLGGVVGHIGQRVHGTAPLQTGQRVLLFLKRLQDSTFMVVGMEQGCFPVTTGKDRVLRLGRRPFDHPPLPDKAGKAGQRSAADLEGHTLDEVKQMVAQVRSQHAQP